MDIITDQVGEFKPNFLPFNVLEANHDSIKRTKINENSSKKKTKNRGKSMNKNGIARKNDFINITDEDRNAHKFIGKKYSEGSNMLHGNFMNDLGNSQLNHQFSIDENIRYQNPR